jgi:hypothetical protein
LLNLLLLRRDSVPQCLNVRGCNLRRGRSGERFLPFGLRCALREYQRPEKGNNGPCKSSFHLHVFLGRSWLNFPPEQISM